MENHPQFEEIREEIEAKQRTVLFEEGSNAGKSVDDFLWKGDPSAKPIQRAGLVVFGLAFLITAIAMFALFAEKYSENGSSIDLVIGLGSLLISIRLLRNAVRRVPKNFKNEDE